ncbi:phosphotransferase [Motilibacter sp. E257]|uniref:Phosphotransferase n=2 Tax=Motilibacter deserti TaxID=2714956 RepID=A0ABX0GW04_9ACTN|nr:fructosamine kinase family protein [Motilibacter deserti]NHC15116.1 phosphotransferase [Motilibacter deserti]
MAVEGLRPVPGGDVCRAYQVRLADGRTVFGKTRPAAPAEFFAVEAAGLRRLAAAGGVPVPEVLGADDDVLVLEWVEPGPPTAPAAERLGRELAATHAAQAASYGADRDGWIGPLPLDNSPTVGWAEFYAARRVEPFLRRAVQDGAVGAEDARDVERALDRIAVLAGPPEPPATVHGDLWSGNVLWGADGRARLVDPAAHGGHRETDLAMLALFGAPLLDRVLAAYAEAAPLAPGWRGRVPLHQLHPLLVHAVLFGPAYGARAGAAARAALRG